jgi:tetratricopeptide (TPR) repeat protein
MTTRTVGRFSIQHEAGRGGMGVVYRAVDARTGAPVAVKVLPREAEDTESAARFEREAATLAAMQHPSIVRYVGHGRTERGELYLAMDWLDGEDLASVLGRGPLPLREAVELAATLADALAAVHARGLVHRDLKPSNVMLAGGVVRRPILLDFGIARRTAAAALTRSGAVVGTPQYMAPEQVRGAATIDGRADLFGLGLILFECITGRPAFVAEHPVAVLAKILLEAPPTISKPGRAIPASLEALVAELLAKDPAARPANAASVGLALQAIATELGEDWVARNATATRAVPAVLTGTERRLVAVLLAADRSASAALAATATPDVASREAAALEAAVRPHGAELAPLGPLRYLVSFPGGGEATDQAGRAARCALALSAAWPEAVIALSLGGAQEQRSLVGEVIDRAARLLNAEGASRVRADDATAALLEIRFQVEVDGGAHAIVGEREPEERPRTLLGKPTRFVGRDRDLASLEGGLREVVDESVARALLVTGVSGAGKSRLRHEFLERVRARDASVAVLLVRAEPVRAGSPLDLCAGLVRAAVGIAGADDDASRAALSARAARLGATEGERADAAAFLGEIIGTPYAVEASPRLGPARQDARILGDQMLRAFLALIGECARQPVVLVLEDLHWSDPQTVRFLDAALREHANLPLFVLAFARPEVAERFPGLWRARGLSEVALGPLSPRACERLALDVLGEVDPATLARIIRHADGNALHLEELIRAAASGDLASVPASVIAMLQARLESLDAVARRVLRAASLLGEAFSREALGALLPDPAADVDAALDRLAEAEVAARRGDAFAFRHAAVREAAYAMLTDIDKRVGHGVVARWLEESGERDASVVAEHYDRAGATAEAALWFARAARQAAQRCDLEAALARGARAIELGAVGVVAAEALLARGRAYHGLGRLAEASAEIELALASLPDDAADLRLAAMRELYNVGTYRQVSSVIRRAGEGALELARVTGRLDLVAEARCALAVADHCDERCAEALDAYRVAVAAAPERPSFVFAVSSILLYHAGAYDEAERTSRRFIAGARDMGDHGTAATLLGNLGAIVAGLGRYAEAREHFAEARSLGERHGFAMVTARAMSLSGGHYLDVLDVEGAVRRAEETCEIGRKMEFVTPRISSSLDLAFAALRRRALHEATEIADAIAEPVAKGTGFHGWLWRSRMLVVRAEIAELSGAFAEAEALADAAIAASRAQGRLKYVAAAEIVRARAAAGLGRSEQGGAALIQLLPRVLELGDPAVALRVASAAFALTGDAAMRDAAGHAASRIEQGLPVDDRARFARAAEPLLERGA